MALSVTNRHVWTHSLHRSTGGTPRSDSCRSAGAFVIKAGARLEGRGILYRQRRRDRVHTGIMKTSKTFRFEVADVHTWQELAVAGGLTLSEWIRRQCNRERDLREYEKGEVNFEK